MRTAAWEPRDTAREMSPTSLYVHVPFCASRCFYCDFTTYVSPPEVRQAYVEALIAEFALLAPCVDQPLQTVFLGGGTPTLLTAEQLEQLLRGLHTVFPLDPEAEITVESNPGTVDARKLEALLAGGVNRISFGAQTFSDRLLLAIGRQHDAEAVYASVASARTAGFTNVNVDLMFGLPEQTVDDVDAALAAVLELDVDHVSAYWLKVEPGTPFAKWQEAGLLPLPGEDEEADMYNRTRTVLEASGLQQYEISNFARPGREARHNLVYWRNEPYLAAGVGAHGYLRGVRYQNSKSLAQYRAAVLEGKRPIVEEIAVTPGEAMEDTMMLGLRLREGVSDRRFRARHGCSIEDVFGQVVTRLKVAGLLQWQGDALTIPASVWPVANTVFEAFIGALASD